MDVRYDLDAENVGEPRSTIAAKRAEDEVLAFLVEYQDTRQHVELIAICRKLWVCKHREVVNSRRSARRELPHDVGVAPRLPPRSCSVTHVLRLFMHKVFLVMG